VPLAFLGGLTQLQEKTFFLLLGASLVASASLMFFQKTNVPAIGADSRPTALPIGLGGAIGYLSGLVAIGGGIFLSPLLHLLRWDTPKNIAATASFFILANSFFGLAGQFWSGRFAFDAAFVIPLLAAVLLGGQVGSRLSAFQFRQAQVRWITAAIVFYAGVNILSKNL
jgi:uncharacterized membrane protein YfcA